MPEVFDLYSADIINNLFPGQALRLYMVAQDINSKVFAESIGISSTRLSEFKSGHSALDDEMVTKVIKAFGW